MFDSTLGSGYDFGNFMCTVTCQCGAKFKVHAQANALAPSSNLCEKCFERYQENERMALGGDHD